MRGGEEFRRWFDTKLPFSDPYAGLTPHELLEDKPDIFLRRVQQKWEGVGWQSFVKLESKETGDNSGAFDFGLHINQVQKLQQEIANYLDEYEEWWTLLVDKERNFCNAVKKHLWTRKNNSNLELRGLMEKFAGYKYGTVNSIVSYYYADAEERNLSIVSEELLEKLGFEKCRVCSRG